MASAFASVGRRCAGVVAHVLAGLLASLKRVFVGVVCGVRHCVYATGACAVGILPFGEEGAFALNLARKGRGVGWSWKVGCAPPLLSARS